MTPDTAKLARLLKDSEALDASREKATPGKWWMIDRGEMGREVVDGIAYKFDLIGVQCGKVHGFDIRSKADAEMILAARNRHPNIDTALARLAIATDIARSMIAVEYTPIMARNEMVDLTKALRAVIDSIGDGE